MRRSRSSSRWGRLSEWRRRVIRPNDGAAALSAAAATGRGGWRSNLALLVVALLALAVGRPDRARYRARPPLHRRSHRADRNRFRAALSHRPDRRLDLRRDAAEECRGSRPAAEFSLTSPEIDVDWTPGAWLRNASISTGVEADRLTLLRLPKLKKDRAQGADPAQVRHPYRQSEDPPARAWRRRSRALPEPGACHGKATFEAGRAVIDLRAGHDCDGDRLAHALDAEPDGEPLRPRGRVSIRRQTALCPAMLGLQAARST